MNQLHVNAKFLPYLQVVLNIKSDHLESR